MNDSAASSIALMFLGRESGGLSSAVVSGLDRGDPRPVVVVLALRPGPGPEPLPCSSCYAHGERVGAQEPPAARC